MTLNTFHNAGISSNMFHPVGSVGKKSSSGDIDLAVSANELFPQGITSQSMQRWNIAPEEFVTRFDAFKKRARSSTDEQLAMKTALVLISEYINEHAPNIHMEPKKANPGNAFGMFPQYDQEGKILFASQDGERSDLTSKNLMNSYLKHPLMTFKIISAIHFEAFKLWIKGIKFIKKKFKIKNNITVEN